MMVMLTLLCLFYLVTASLLIHGARKVVVMIIVTIIMISVMIIVTIIMIIVTIIMMIIIIICNCDHPEKIIN